MATICPTVTATDTHHYREQMEEVAPFAKRIHIDFMDGVFAPTVSPGLAQAWWPDSVHADLHVMYQRPEEYLEAVIKLRPSLVIVHAEADGNFVNIAKELHEHGIKAGIGLLAPTKIEVIKPALEHIDHVLIFSGHLGHFGGMADLELLSKVAECKNLKPELEIGWDGGVNDKNAHALVEGGIDVLNVGGYIHKATNPKGHYEACTLASPKGLWYTYSKRWRK